MGRADTWQSPAQAVSLRPVWGTVHTQGLCRDGLLSGSSSPFGKEVLVTPRPGTAQASSSSRALLGKGAWELLARRVDNPGFQAACLRQGL